MKTPLLESFFIKIADLKAFNFIKKRLQQRRFPMNNVKYLRTPFLQNTSGRLLLIRAKHHEINMKIFEFTGCIAPVNRQH